MTVRLPSASIACLMLAACGQPAPDAAPSATAAAAKGVADVVASQAAGRPFPADLPDFVTPMPGGKYLTSTKGRNVERSTGTLLYDTPGTPAEAIAFHREAMTKAGFALVVGETREVRSNKETLIEGKHPDGRTLTAIVIEGDSGTPAVQMNYMIPKS